MKWLASQQPGRTLRVAALLGALFIVGGAIINVAVAWGTAIGVRSVPLDTDLLSQLRQNWRVDPMFAQDRYAGTNWPNEACHRLGVVVVKRDSVYYEYRVGLPFSSFKASAKMSATISPSVHNSFDYNDAIVLPMSTRLTNGEPSHTTEIVRSVLPLRPIPLAVLLNTIIYAAILWLLFTAPGFVRRRIRINRGVCPACAYPTGASDVCTECGTPLRIQKS